MASTATSTVTPTAPVGHRHDMQLSKFDLYVIAIYFIVLMMILGVSLVRQRAFKSATFGIAEFFRAGHAMHWAVVACSLYSSNIGSEHLVGLIGGAAQFGVASSWGEFPSTFMLLLLGWCLYPRMYLGIASVPQWWGARYGRRMQKTFAAVTVALYVITKISVAVFSGALLASTFLPLNAGLSTALVVVGAGLYTIIGGLHVIMWVEVMQTAVMLFALVLITALACDRVATQAAVHNMTFGGYIAASVPPSHLHLIQPADSNSFPWPATPIAFPLAALWYWTVDQMMVQRVIAARSESHGIAGCVGGAVLKLSVLPTFILSGVLARVLWPLDMSKDANGAFPALTLRLLPAGARGIIASACLAAIMSSLSSTFHSVATIVALDLRPACIAERHSVAFGRCVTFCCAAAGVSLAPFITRVSPHLYIFTHKVMSYGAPPIAVLFLLGIPRARPREASALFGACVAWCFGAGRLLGELFADSSKAIAFAPIHFWIRMPFAYFSVALSGVTFVTVAAMELFFAYRSARASHSTRIWLQFWTASPSPRRRYSPQQLDASEMRDCAVGCSSLSESVETLSFVPKMPHDDAMSSSFDPAIEIITTNEPAGDPLPSPRQPTALLRDGDMPSAAAQPQPAPTPPQPVPLLPFKIVSVLVVGLLLAYIVAFF